MKVTETFCDICGKGLTDEECYRIKAHLIDIGMTMKKKHLFLKFQIGNNDPEIPDICKSCGMAIVEFVKEWKKQFAI